MKTILLAGLSITFLTLGGCATGPSVASYGAGSDAAYIKENRNRRDAVSSDAEYEQRAKSRNDIRNEMLLEREKQDHTLNTWLTPFKFLRGSGLLRL